MSSNEMEERIKILKRQIKEYEYMEKVFGVDKKGKLQYDEEKNHVLAIESMENKRKNYIDHKSFLKWVNKKTKSELQDELKELGKQDEKKKVISPSDEQLAIIDSVSKGKNVMVDAVAGSGKTTTVMFLAMENRNKNILQVTYNKQLKFEVREKAEVHNLKNLEVHTYHSLCVKFYDKEAHTDDKIINVLSNNISPKITKHYDIIITDEVQDMTRNYFSLICKFIKDMKLDKSTILILGDRYQGIYDFKNADTRFLTYSDKIWNDKSDFVRLPLQESYRVTEQIAWFVNRAMLGADRIISNKKGKHAVQYYKRSVFSIHGQFAKLITEFISKGGYNPADIFVLAPSLKSTNNPVKRLENELVKNKIPVYFSRNEEDGLDEDVIKGKVAFTTFHQSKGRERKIVFVFGFDNSYFDYHAREKIRSECPSELYVAVTRASEILIVVESSDKDQLEFMKCDTDQLKNTKMVDYYGIPPKKDAKKKEKKKVVEKENIHSTTVSELTSYISEENNEKLIDVLDQLFKIENKPSAKCTVDIPSNIRTDNGKTEDVSDINGLAIPSMYETKISKECTMQTIIDNLYKSADQKTKDFITEKMKELNKYVGKNKIASFLCLGNLYIALGENIYSKLNQIDKYDWLSKDMVDVCHENLSNNIGKHPAFEQELGNFENETGKYFKYISNDYGTIEIRGRVDAYDDSVLWEFKCVNALQNEHLLQLTVYAWLWEKCEGSHKKYKILNIRTGEVRRLKYQPHLVEEVMSILFQNKYYKKPKDSDKIFIENCNNIRKKISSSTNKPLEKKLFTSFDDKSKKSKKNYSDEDEDDDEDNDKSTGKNMFR